MPVNTNVFAAPFATLIFAALGVGRIYTTIAAAPAPAPTPAVRTMSEVLEASQPSDWRPLDPARTLYCGRAEQRVPIRTVRVMADVPKAERTPLEVLRTDTPTFKALAESRRNRADEWFKYRAGRVEVCNVPIPVRTPPTN